MPDFELEDFYNSVGVFGVDEAGLGPLAGPIVAASCCIIDHDIIKNAPVKIDDSKKLTKKQRKESFNFLTNLPQNSLKFKTFVMSNDEIDSLGLSKAWELSLKNSVLGFDINTCLIDGNRNFQISENCLSVSIVRGDQKSFSIAAASIIAKVSRDMIMLKIHEEFPQYGFDQHVGYGTQNHMIALEKFGPCRYHRKSYKPVAKFFI